MANVTDGLNGLGRLGIAAREQLDRELCVVGRADVARGERSWRLVVARRSSRRLGKAIYIAWTSIVDVPWRFVGAFTRIGRAYARRVERPAIFKRITPVSPRRGSETIQSRRSLKVSATICVRARVIGRIGAAITRRLAV